MASSSDWIGEWAREPASTPGQSGWIAALALDGQAAPTGFRDASPFAPSKSGIALESLERITSESAIPTTVSDAIEADDRAAVEYQRGYEAGLTEAQCQGEAAIAQERARFRDLRFAFRTLDAAALDALAQDLSATVLELCQPVLGEYALDPQALTSRCEAAAKRLGAGPRDLTLRLHPETLARLDEAALPGWTFVEDEDLAPGALSVTGPDGTARDGPEDWSRAIAEALRG